MKLSTRFAFIITVLFAGGTVASAQTTLSRFAYVANYNSGDVSGYAIDPATGALTPVPGSPFSALCPVSVLVDPTGRFAYVPNFCGGFVDSGSISAFMIDSTSGSLNPIPGSPFALLSGTGATSAVIDPTGKFLYATLSAYNFGAVAGFAINAVSGALTPISGSPFAEGFPVSPLAIDPTGKFAYMEQTATSNTILLGFAIDSTTGFLSSVPGSPFPAGSLFPITVDPTGKFAYASDPSAGVLAFAIDGTTGTLTPIPGSPFPALLAISVTIDPASKFAYVVDNSCGFPADGTVTGFTIDGSSGALTQIGSPFPAGSCPQSMTMHPTGKFAYVVPANSGLLGYAIDGATGTLSPVPGSPFQATSGLVPLTIDSTGRFAYVTFGVQGVLAFTIDPITGALTPVPGSPFAAGTNPQAVTLTPGPSPTVTHTLTVASTNPNSTVAITASPSDNSGKGNGTTPFSLSYSDGAVVTLTALTTASGNNFSNWTGCDSAPSTTCTVTMNADRTVTANYVIPPPTCSVSSIQADKSLSNGVFDASISAGASPCQFTITLRNLKNYWTNFTLSTVGTVTVTPVGGNLNLYAKYGLLPPSSFLPLPPGKSVSFTVQVSMPGQSVTIFADPTLNSGKAAGAMNIVQSILNVLPLGSLPVLVIDDFQKIAELFPQMPDLEAAISDLFQNTPQLVKAAQDLFRLSTNSGELFALAFLATELGFNIGSDVIKSLLRSPFRIFNSLVTIFGNLRTAFFQYPAGSIAFVAR